MNAGLGKRKRRKAQKGAKRETAIFTTEGGKREHNIYQAEGIQFSSGVSGGASSVLPGIGESPGLVPGKVRLAVQPEAHRCKPGG